ncbi:MAG: ParB/RepB/Spo0J family partition protein [Cytophagales bacterium]|nr:ParB/RepB/Spo0J family partition protein [Bernardetiaceae bacterium]MDW8203571.1 ParB/RepB/Spo0J family partition protein [Cytophagales bacterium]
MSDKPQLKKRTGLGKGLSALLEDTTPGQLATDAVSDNVLVGRIHEIPLEQIEVNPFQPRTEFDRNALEELAESIRVQGIIQPITVRQLEPSRYQLISGERRLKAAKLAGLTHIPAYIRTANDQQMLEMALIENIQREELNAIEIALSYQRLITECHLKQEELGERVGKNRSTVTNYLRLLKLPPDIQAGLRDRKLTMGHARALINIDNVEEQLTIFKKILEEEWSVRKTEDAVRALLTKPEKRKTIQKTTAANPEIIQLQNRLSNRYGTRVQVSRNEQGRGEIKIPFFSDEDLNRIIELLEQP